MPRNRIFLDYFQETDPRRNLRFSKRFYLDSKPFFLRMGGFLPENMKKLAGLFPWWQNKLVATIFLVSERKSSYNQEKRLKIKIKTFWKPEIASWISFLEIVEQKPIPSTYNIKHPKNMGNMPLYICAWFSHMLTRRIN